MRRPTPAGQGSVGDCPLPLVRALSEIVPSRWSGLCRRDEGIASGTRNSRLPPLR